MAYNNKKLSRKERRLLNQGKDIEQKLNFTLREINPLTDNQKLAFEAFDKGRNLMLHGMAGTGKSFISIYLALKQILKNDSPYKQIVVVRSVVPTRDMGFLPGSHKEKTKVYEQPYYSIFTELFDRSDAYEYLKNKGLVDFISTSFIRGVTLNDCIIIVDEIANCTLHELDSVITRIGKNCKIIFCGDFRQSDFVKYSDKQGLHDFIKIINNMRAFEFVDFDEDDIIRSALVKDYIIQKHRLEISA